MVESIPSMVPGKFCDSNKLTAYSNAFASEEPDVGDAIKGD